MPKISKKQKEISHEKQTEDVYEDMKLLSKVGVSIENIEEIRYDSENIIYSLPVSVGGAIGFTSTAFYELVNYDPNSKKKFSGKKTITYSYGLMM